MRNTSKSILGQYSDNKPAKKTKNDSQVPLMANYEQRYKGGMVKSVTTPAPRQTLEQKIQARENPVSSTDNSTRIPVVIGGTRYVLGTSDDLSASRIHSIAKLTNKFFEDAKSTNPGLTNSKAAILALIDACDELVSLRNEINNLKTDLMYYQQQDFINKSSSNIEPTPMEKLANSKGDNEAK